MSPSAVDNRAASIITSEASLMNYQGEGNQVNFQGGGAPPPAPLPCPPGAAPEVYQAAYAAAFYAQQSRMAQQMAHQQHPTAESTGAPGNMNAAAGAFPSTPGPMSAQTAPPVTASGSPPSPAADTATGTSSSPTNSSTINICRYFAQGYCTQGEGCNFSHAQGPAPTVAAATSRRTARGGKAARNEHNELLDAEGRVKFTAIEEVNGQVLSLAQDQHGCRFLQKKIDEGGPEAVAAIFPEVLQCVVELMVDPFGNYLVQKLLECCSERQRVQILQAVSEPAADGMPKVIGVALNTHGTRAVQKLVETLRSAEQVQLAIQALEPGVVPLIKDLNGNHVVQRCLQRLGAIDSQFIYNAAGRHCVEIGTHRHGCCVLQRCVDHATGPQREHLVSEIAVNALALAQDPFGNYVVQYVLELGMSMASSKVIRALAGEYAPLSLQKFSSNVVEKCLKLGGPELEEDRKIIVREIMVSPHLGRLLQDAYGNYVVQSTLAIAKGDLHCELVEHIRPHLAAIKSSPYGKRILARSHLLQKKSAAGG
ncbi:hypothetical protein CYMTET_56216 [Cymbomonas tetramitiformis]|uniref:Uncharacterized protein n=1 Tax=Cymbomonas tetramitiformis TaxID=36881 RepID=A0AAE0BCM5_9CHLO|nr:hypothetical protein CYMTET_56216 [Cymbomonas tetramitiformis]